MTQERKHKWCQVGSGSGNQQPRGSAGWEKLSWWGEQGVDLNLVLLMQIRGYSAPTGVERTVVP